MSETTIYYILSIITALLALWAPFAANRAIKKGLTYSSISAVVVTLVFLAAGRVWHTTYEITNLRAIWGGAVEMVEYLIYIFGYIIFIWLNHKTDKAKSPNN